MFDFRLPVIFRSVVTATIEKIDVENGEIDECGDWLQTHITKWRICKDKQDLQGQGQGQGLDLQGQGLDRQGQGQGQGQGLTNSP